MHKFHVKKGHPYPLGATKTATGFNFAVYSKSAITLVLAEPTDPEKLIEIPLDEQLHTTGSIWHIGIDSSEEWLYYAYKNGSDLLLDPYAKYIDTGNVYGKNRWGEKKRPLGIASAPLPFDWAGEKAPLHPLEKLIIYEMHVRGFTKQNANGGTYSDVVKAIPYLKDLGITAVELMPVLEFDESDCPFMQPDTATRLYNYWGYSPLSFFAPMMRYSREEDARHAAREFKTMVKALHENGIEVLLDVVFNHTGEGNEDGKTISWKGLSYKDYYLIDDNDNYLNYSGCGNTLNCNNPIVQDHIMSSLRSWVSEYHVDGFRFDLASIFARGYTGAPLASAPLLERITADPLLKRVKLIAEPWDAAGLHQVGAFFRAAWKREARWLEWNDDYRTVVRRFIRGDAGYAGRFATKICGSQDVYKDGGSPLNSLNYITCHDGFTLRDLVSYNEKHNEENGENNRDGISYNDSWNCGVEGPTDDTQIEELRLRQMKNFLLALFCSLGIPMLQMGDEYGHTRFGNNNAWSHDDAHNWFQWDAITKSELLPFCTQLIKLRKQFPLFSKTKFLTNHDIEWHGIEPHEPDWSQTSHLVAYTLTAATTQLYIAFNASAEAQSIALPHPRKGRSWTPLLFTGSESAVVKDTICLEEYSAVVLSNG